MKTKAAIIIALHLALTGTVVAAWNKFDDFEGGDLSKWKFTQSDVGTKADSSATIVIDPEPAGAAAGNHVVLLNPGSPFSSDHRSRLIGRPAPIKYGTTGTAFFRWYTKTVLRNGAQVAPTIDMVVGMSAVDLPTQYAETGPLSGYKDGPAIFRAYNGDANPANPASVIGFQNILTNRPNDVWVSQWFYIRNYSVAQQMQDYQIYYRVGNTGTPILAYPFVPGEFAGFRAKPDGDLDAASAHLDVFFFTNSAGNIAAPTGLDAAFYADDVYIDQDGINLTDPTGAGGGGAGSGSGLTNVSTRGQVGAAEKMMITGFVITGSQPQQILIRAAGPTLAKFGVAGVLAKPSLKVVSSVGKVVGTNSGWGSATNAAEITTAAASVGAFTFASGSADAAMLVTVPPGVYTAQLTGADGGTGIALLEVYTIAQ